MDSANFMGLDPENWRSPARERVWLRGQPNFFNLFSWKLPHLVSVCSVACRRGLSGWTMVRRTEQHGRYEFVFYHDTVTLLFSGVPDPFGRGEWPSGPRRSLPQRTSFL